MSIMKVTMISHQFKKVAPAMQRSTVGMSAAMTSFHWHDSCITPAGNPESWQGAVDVLMGNSINLMNAIKDLLKAAEIASAITATSSKGSYTKFQPTYLSWWSSPPYNPSLTSISLHQPLTPLILCTNTNSRSLPQNTEPHQVKREAISPG